MDIKDIANLRNQLQSIASVFDQFRTAIIELDPETDKNEYKFYVTLFVMYSDAVNSLVYVCRHMGDANVLRLQPRDFRSFFDHGDEIHRLIIDINKKYFQITSALRDYMGPRQACIARGNHIWLSSLAIEYGNRYPHHTTTEESKT